MKKCISCGADNRDDATFCSSCGTSFPSAAVKPIPSVKVVTPVAPLGAALRVPPPGMCFYHPNLPAVYVCNRCGRSICRDDSKTYADLVLCPQCYAGVVPVGAVPAHAPAVPSYAPAVPEYAPMVPEAMPAMAVMPPPAPMGWGIGGPPYMPPRPRAIWGFIFLLAASILVMINGFFVFYGLGISAPWVATWFFWLWSWAVSWGVATTGTVVIGLGVVLGLCLMLAAFLTYVGYETFGGIIGFICALLSIVIGGGFFAGLALGLIGGILAILRK